MLKVTGYWYIAAAARELGTSPLRRVAPGETLVLFRDGAGRARALVDRCAHRGMALSHGKVKAGCLQCPYHGWRYDGEGTLTEVPALTAGEPLCSTTGSGVPFALTSTGHASSPPGSGTCDGLAR